MAVTPRQSLDEALRELQAQKDRWATLRVIEKCSLLEQARACPAAGRPALGRCVGARQADRSRVAVGR